MSNRTEITKETRIAALLRDYPETEELLIGMSPAFEKLRNPVLRRSVARVATLGHAAVVGGLAVGDLVNELRVAVGQVPIEDIGEVDGTDYFGTCPDWFDPNAVVVVLREGDLDPNVMPINPLLRAVRDLGRGQIAELVTRHLPAPGIVTLRRKGYLVWSTKDDEVVRTYATKAIE